VVHPVWVVVLGCLLALGFWTLLSLLVLVLMLFVGPSVSYLLSVSSQPLWFLMDGSQLE
jgi:uncharacterized membrane protein YphA (DoxX/SURF4 family)